MNVMPETNYMKEVRKTTKEIKKHLYSILETLEILKDPELMEQIKG